MKMVAPGMKFADISIKLIGNERKFRVYSWGCDGDKTGRLWLYQHCRM